MESPPSLIYSWVHFHLECSDTLLTHASNQLILEHLLHIPTKHIFSQNLVTSHIKAEREYTFSTCVTNLANDKLEILFSYFH